MAIGSSVSCFTVASGSMQLESEDASSIGSFLIITSSKVLTCLKKTIISLPITYNSDAQHEGASLLFTMT